MDQYSSTLQALSQTPACQVSADPAVPDPLDDPVCGQLDLDFGAAANLFRTSSGTELVGDLQKSGVYHVADAATMKPAWTALVGASCQACNAASTAVYGGSVYGVGTPAGVEFSLAGDSGRSDLAQPGGRWHPLRVDQRGRRRRLDGRQPGQPGWVRCGHRPGAGAPAAQRGRRRTDRQQHELGRGDRRARAVRGSGWRGLRVDAPATWSPTAPRARRSARGFTTTCARARDRSRRCGRGHPARPCPRRSARNRRSARSPRSARGGSTWE